MGMAGLIEKGRRKKKNHQTRGASVSKLGYAEIGPNSKPYLVAIDDGHTIRINTR